MQICNKCTIVTKIAFLPYEILVEYQDSAKPLLLKIQDNRSEI